MEETDNNVVWEMRLFTFHFQLKSIVWIWIKIWFWVKVGTAQTELGRTRVQVLEMGT